MVLEQKGSDPTTVDDSNKHCRVACSGVGSRLDPPPLCCSIHVRSVGGAGGGGLSAEEAGSSDVPKSEMGEGEPRGGVARSGGATRGALWRSILEIINRAPHLSTRACDGDVAVAR
jgi:hypothetical protein